MIFIIDDILEEMILEGKSHFSPHYICNRSGINDLKNVSEYLISLVGKKLKVFFEVECPEGDSDFAIPSLSELPTGERECHICGTLYTPNIDKIWIAFDFTSDYKEYVKKKKKKHQKENKHHLMLL